MACLSLIVFVLRGYGLCFLYAVCIVVVLHSVCVAPAIGMYLISMFMLISHWILK